MASLALLGEVALARPEIAVDSPRWRLESEHDGIRVYSAHVLETGIVPFKAVMTIPASIEEISAVLQDASRRGEWVARFGGSVLLERESDYVQTQYVRMSMPWPLSDRTTLVRVSIVVSDDLRTVSLIGRSVDCCAQAAARFPEFVRAEVYESTFRMQKKGDGTEVTTLVFVDPRGNIPQWVVNLFTGGEARRTLVGLRRQVARRLYAQDVLQMFRQRMLGYAAHRAREQRFSR